MLHVELLGVPHDGLPLEGLVAVPAEHTEVGSRPGPHGAAGGEEVPLELPLPKLARAVHDAVAEPAPDPHPRLWGWRGDPAPQ